MGRVLGVDLGTRRIGLALSDPLGVMASPLAVIERRGDPAADHRAILEAAREAEAERIVVGLPVSLSGRLGPAAKAAQAEIAALAGLAAAGPRAVLVEPYDERLTTVTAERALVAGGVRRKDRRGVVDKVAAAVMLQAWLDGRRDPGGGP